MTMTKKNARSWAVVLVVLLVGATAYADVTDQPIESSAGVNPQCPGDTDGDGVPEPGAPGYDPNVTCMHLTAGDGFVMMADGRIVPEN